MKAGILLPKVVPVPRRQARPVAGSGSSEPGRARRRSRRGPRAPFGAWVLVVLGCWGLQAAPDLEAVDQYNVVWETPSTNHHGSMPLGNGEVGVNAWMTPDGHLHCYLARTDAWDDYARLVKVGKVRFLFEPNPVQAGVAFRRELHLRSGTLEIRTGAGSGVGIQLWVDAHLPVLHLLAEAEKPFTVTAVVELWRTNRTATRQLEVSDVLRNHPAPDSEEATMVLEPDALLRGLNGRIGWYHHNVKSVGPRLMAEIQGLAQYPQADPLLHRTFGGLVAADGGQRLDDGRLRSGPARRHHFRVVVTTLHPATPEGWLASAERVLRQVESDGLARRRALHEAWWSEFWARSWIRAWQARSISRVVTPLVPVNAHPVRIGQDRDGGNRWVGEIGRLSIWNRPLGEELVARLAGAGPGESPEGLPPPLYQVRQPALGVVGGSAAWEFREGLTVEAWIRPETLGPGGARIVDKVTPGVDDGFLLDTWPGNSVRFICGPHVLRVADASPAGQWTHVVAVADPEGAGCRLYVNGRLVARSDSPPIRDEAALVSQMYHLQRFITAAAGRGRYPIKFNGSLFTVPPGPTEADPDYRRWGPGYWWQNTRLPYYAMCAAGDFDLMEPLFRMYVDELLPLCRYRTQLYLGHGGAFYPECMMFWGAIFSESYGWTPFEQRTDKLQSSRWHKWEWVGGLELAWLALDYYEHTQDRSFLERRALPVTREVLRFFEEHYPTNAQGQLVFHPSQALETWWHCTNAAPEVGGCIALTERLLRLPAGVVPPADRALAQRLRAKLPPLPVRVVEGRTALAPAEFFADKRNIENPELYAVFPFRLFTFHRPRVEWALTALEHRWDRGHVGWRQDDLFMACLGLVHDTRHAVVERARRHDPSQRFPAFWGPNFDWTPDQCHGGVLMRTLQAMVLQADGDQIFLLPAWPRDWNVDFRLHAPKRTIVEGRFEEGQWVRLTVQPPERRRDIVLVPAR